jgi:hypothetical protein
MIEVCTKASRNKTDQFFGCCNNANKAIIFHFRPSILKLTESEKRVLSTSFCDDLFLLNQYSRTKEGFSIRRKVIHHRMAITNAYRPE